MKRLALCLLLAGCGPDFTPGTYDVRAVQQVNKVDQAEIVGFRQVAISADGTVGVVTGGAAGGIAGSQVAGGIGSAFGALGGTIIGGLVGGAVEKTTGSLKGFEYIVRKANGELLSVVQRDVKPLPIGQRVLLIAGAQARIVTDYTVAPAASAPAPVVAATPPPADTALSVPTPATVTSVPLDPPPASKAVP